MQFSNQTSGQEPEFQVEGQIIYSAEIRGPSGKEQVKHSRHFVVARKGQQWKIRTTNLDEDHRFAYGIEYNEMGCDGTKIYELKSFDENNPEISKIKNIITAQGRVRPGNTLAGLDIDLIYPLWIAYCSSDYFLSRQANRMAAPLFNVGNFLTEAVPPALDLPVKWKLDDSKFISEIAWHSEGTYLHEEDGTSRFEKYPPPFDVGFLHANFETTDWINFSEMLILGGFVLKVFAPNWPGEGEAKCVVAYTIDAKVQTVHPLQNFSCLPELTRKTGITDTRYRLGNCSGCLLHYGSSSSWDTEEEIEAKLKSRGIEYEKQTSQG